MTGGATRMARAAGAATLSTLAALTMHVVAGGHLPAAAGALAPWAVSFAVAAQLAGRPLGRLRLAVIVMASQLAFHLAFTLGTSHAAGAHAHHGELALGPLARTVDAPGMPVAHLAAAVVTYSGVRRADAVIRWIARTAWVLARALASGLRAAPAPVLRAPRHRIPNRPVGARLPRRAPRARVTRGPPLPA